MDKLSSKFAAGKLQEGGLIKATAGLVTKEEFARKRKEFEEGGSKDDGNKKKKRRREAKQVLSFDDDLDGEDAQGGGDEVQEEHLPVKRFGEERAKREADEKAERKRLEEEYERKKQAELQETIKVVYNVFPDHRKRHTMVVKKGDSIGDFIIKALHNNDSLKAVKEGIFVKEDLILPKSATFHSFIAEKTKGRSGTLWEFEKMLDDGGRRKTTAIVDERWYARCKDGNPAKSWEHFSFGKNYVKSWKTGTSGDWVCPKCKMMNWGSKNPTHCLKCKGERPVYAPLI